MRVPGSAGPRPHNADGPAPDVLPARPPLLAVLASLILVGACAAQPAADRPALTPSPGDPPRAASLQTLSTNAWGLWVGGSVSSGGLIGNIRRARLGLVGLRYHRLLAPSSPHAGYRGLRLTYTADLIPGFFLSIPSEAIPSPPPAAPSSDASRPFTAYGLGVRPAGLRLAYRSAAWVQPFVAGSTGLAYFPESMPSTRGTSLNFMFDVGAGVRVLLTPALVLTVGYRYHHLSNGFRGQINPGVDANLVQLGVTVTP